MSQYNTDIKFKRSVNYPEEIGEESILFGEPIFIDNTTIKDDGTLNDPCNAYLVLGRKEKVDGEDVTIAKSPVIKAMTLDRANSLVFYVKDNDGNPRALVNEEGIELPANKITSTPVSKDDLSSSNTTKYHILCQPDDGSNTVYKFSLDDLGIFINGRGVMKGAAWNDYAEIRIAKDDVAPGLVVCDTRDGRLELSSERLQPCPHVVSDTYGYLLGEISEEGIPIAVAGRALVAMDYTMSDIDIGDCVCAGLNGLASKMTRQEIINYPDRILGVVCEIPSYNNIGGLDVDDRIWINIK